MQQDYLGIPAHLLLDSLTGAHVVILPSAGGAVNQYSVTDKNTDLDLLAGYSSLADLNENLGLTFKGCNLFPFPNRIADGSYTFNSVSYRLDINFPQENNAIHGIVFNKEFEVINATDGEEDCSLNLRYRPGESHRGYPFDYCLEHDYQLSAAHGFSCTTRITNLGDASIPVGHGYHPYFRLGADSIDDLILSFPAAEMIELDSRNIPTGKRIDYKFFSTPRQIGDTSLDSCFQLQSSADNRAETYLFNPRRDCGLKVWQETGPGKYNYLQIYTPEARDAIAIEPMSCEPDAFHNKQGLILLGAGGKASLSWGIEPITSSRSEKITDD